MSKPYQMRMVEERMGRPIEDVISDLTAEGMTQEAIARQLGVNYCTLRYWLKILKAEYVTQVRFPSIAG